MTKLFPHVYAFALAVIGLVGIIVLVALHDQVPTILQEVTLASLAAGAGLAIPNGNPPTLP